MASVKINVAKILISDYDGRVESKELSYLGQTKMEMAMKFRVIFFQFSSCPLYSRVSRYPGVQFRVFSYRFLDLLTQISSINLWMSKNSHLIANLLINLFILREQGPIT